MRKRNPNVFFDTIEKIDDFVAPETWTIIVALNRVLELAEGSKLNNEFWEKSEEPMAFLTQKLSMNKNQLILLSILAENDSPTDWKDLANFIDLKRLAIMNLTEDMENLVDKGWVRRLCNFDQNVNFVLEEGVLNALQHNQCFTPEVLSCLNTQEFMDKLQCHMNGSEENGYSEFDYDYLWMTKLVKANKELPICQKVLEYNDVFERGILLMGAFDYAEWVGSEYEGLTLDIICRMFRKNNRLTLVRKKLITGDFKLMQDGLIEQKCEDGIANTERYVLTSQAKESLLADYTATIRSNKPRNNRNLIKHTDIKPKQLFFNKEDQEQIDRLAKLLQPKQFKQVQQRLEERGLRKGFACLFHGEPGTGKTESVLQLAKETGRNIFEVNIAGMRDKFVGETEKNIKAVFNQYREICKENEVMPILFFNEADALINKRVENVERSVDKMDNAMQNIILQEIETLDGILIATTNLISNLDNAFDRRFLFKVKFHKPTPDVKAKIWCSMLEDLAEDEANLLAKKYDFSGGQIENIVRKRTVDYILYGEKLGIEKLESFCMDEMLEKKKTHNKIGFGERA